MVQEVKDHGSCLDRWSVGRSKDIAPGDRFYLLHLGVEPRGIMASGWVMSEPESKLHWDGSESSTLYVDIEYDRLFRPDESILHIDTLRSAMPDQHWLPQSSGTFLRSEYLVKMDELWAGNHASNKTLASESPADFIEGTAYTVRMTRYERDPRNRSACIAHHGTACVVCEFDFKTRYGSLGEGFIHVHHLNPLAATRGAHVLDPIRDMRPVCPNCHAMLHRKKALLSIDELKAIVRK
ncbi:MAG: HNH endonuclease [Flavobacteriales bacterium]|nr:HNH endonuclease [Flavobacteriales bacterium]